MQNLTLPRFQTVTKTLSLSVFALAAFAGESFATSINVISFNTSGANPESLLTADQAAGAFVDPDTSGPVDHWMSPSGFNFGKKQSLFDNSGGWAGSAAGIIYTMGAVNGTSAILPPGQDNPYLYLDPTGDGLMMRGFAGLGRISPTVNTVDGVGHNTNNWNLTQSFVYLGGADSGVLYDLFVYHNGGHIQDAQNPTSLSGEVPLNAILSTGTGGSAPEYRYTTTSQENFDGTFIEGSNTVYSSGSRELSNYVKFTGIQAGVLTNQTLTTNEGGSTTPLFFNDEPRSPIGIVLELNNDTGTKQDAIGVSGVQLVAHQPTWKGTGSSTWTNDLGNTNFERDSVDFSVTGTTFVRFDQNSGSNYTVNPDAAGVNAGKIDIVTSVAHPYIFTATGAIGGPASLNKDGEGSLTIQGNSNSFTGTVRIGEGSVDVATLGSANGAADVPSLPPGWLIGEVPAKAGALGMGRDITLGSGTVETGLKAAVLNYSGPTDRVYRGIFSAGGGATINVMNASTELDLRYFITDADLVKTGPGTLIFRGGSAGQFGTKLIVDEGFLFQDNEATRRTTGIGAEARAGGTFGGFGSMNAAAITIRAGGGFKPGVQESINYADDVDFEARTTSGVGSTVVFESGSKMILDLLNQNNDMTSSTHLALDTTASSLHLSTLSFEGNLILELANPNLINPNLTDRFYLVDGVTPGNYIGFSLSGENVSIDLANSGFAFANPGFAGNVGYDNNDIYITGLVLIPEPSTIATLLGGIGTLVGFRRLNRRRLVS